MRDFQAQCTCRIQQPVKVIKSAELRQDVLVSAFSRSDRPGTADIMGFGAQSIVRAFAIDAPNGMDRREIQNVESHLREIGQPRLDVPEGSVRPAFRGGRPWK